VCELHRRRDFYRCDLHPRVPKASSENVSLREGCEGRYSVTTLANIIAIINSTTAVDSVVIHPAIFVLSIKSSKPQDMRSIETECSKNTIEFCHPEEGR
jgi:hypothetical protein